jgi:hypothetical protein
VSFHDDVEATPGLGTNAYRIGLRALSSAARLSIAMKHRHRPTGSVDIDAALTTLFPNDPRWDYVVAVAGTTGVEELYWIELHPANGGGCIAEMMKKAEWLNEWLAKDGQRLGPRRYSGRRFWVATGRCGFHANAPQMKKLAMLGVSPPARTLRIPC